MKSTPLRAMYATLTTCPLFVGLNEEQIRGLFQDQDYYTVTRYGDGAYIARRDTAYSGLMIILEGRVRGEVVDPSGKTITVDTIQAPQLISPAFLFGGYNKLPIDVVAQGEVEILTLHRGYLFELMQAHVLVMSNFIDIISDRASQWSKKIYLLSMRSLQQRVANYLLECTTDTSPTLPIPELTQIATHFDATRIGVMTALAELEKRGLIRSDPRTIRVLRREGLNDLLQSK